MKQYRTQEDIKRDLRRLQLEKQIAWEELKVVKSDFKETLQPYTWLQTGFKMASKVGVMMLIKKIIR
ncbi:hypothetical protein [Mesoflavibacter sp. CH_XMU1404-2]|uniref:hypothetical protein n=1 Tax=Mesoflavibacter sp. CH_XMU1404-2 TaxID=3107766 RepID=UPI00243CCAF4|tara:strand:- start:451 stop:651 length:201 start_codon:yes stop_codon:yes gene_type:complete